MVNVDFRAEGLVAKDDVLSGRRGLYHFHEDGKVMITKAPVFDKSTDEFRGRKEVLDGPLE